MNFIYSITLRLLFGVDVGHVCVHSPRRSLAVSRSFTVAEKAQKTSHKLRFIRLPQMLMHNRQVDNVMTQPFCDRVLYAPQLPVLRAFYFVNKK
ncbi:hypothetical protein [Pseudomonas libanensis]|uniref:hypothetical protein n=1 Tax=Pseudomonas libanensis TaxID=75588 RepID=UPI0012E34771|nr:hypothetical protein [Pseudomonas libanensis]